MAEAGTFTSATGVVQLIVFTTAPVWSKSVDICVPIVDVCVEANILIFHFNMYNLHPPLTQ